MTRMNVLTCIIIYALGFGGFMIALDNHLAKQEMLSHQ